MSFTEVSSCVISGVQVKKLKSNSTGLVVCIAQVEGPLVNGYFCLGNSQYITSSSCPEYTSTSHVNDYRISWFLRFNGPLNQYTKLYIKGVSSNGKRWNRACGDKKEKKSTKTLKLNKYSMFDDVIVAL